MYNLMGFQNSFGVCVCTNENTFLIWVMIYDVLDSGVLNQFMDSSCITDI